MRLEVKGHIFPKVWDIVKSVEKLRDERRAVNIGSGTVGYPVYLVELPEGTRREGVYLVPPSGVKLYWHPGDQYEIGYLISEVDEDPLVGRHFKK
jgi:hypothetical protein